MYIEQEKQLSFNHGWFEVPQLDQNHKLIKIAQAIYWESLLSRLSKFYNNSFGRPTKPARAKVGLLIVKHLYKLSDREVIDELKSNMYVQYLCDINPRDAHDFMNYSSLCKFRKAIGKEGVVIIDDEIFQVLKRANMLKGRKSKQLTIDTTVVPSPIAYPTDINLLEKCRKTLVKTIENAKEFGTKPQRTYKRIAKKVFLQYQKLRRISKNIRRKTQKKLLQFVRRNIKQITNVIEQVNKTPNTKAKQQFQEQANILKNKTTRILKQQQDVYHGKSVKERIVSLWAGHIRPMVRGKFPIEVEFGAKILLSKTSDFLFFNKLSFENESDVNMVPDAITDYKKRFKSTPAELAGDRGFYSKDNINFAVKQQIKNVAITKKGCTKVISYCKRPAYDRLNRVRCAIESKISLAKRKFGLDRINYKMHDGEEMWIRLGLSAMNLNFAFA